MDTKAVITGSVALVAIIAVVVGTYVWVKERGPTPLKLDTSYAVPASVAVTHTKNGDTHIFSGSIPMTSTCNKVGSGISYDEVSGRIKAVLSIGILKAEDGACEGVADGTTQTFTTSFKPAHALPVDLVKLKVNGSEVVFTTN